MTTAVVAIAHGTVERLDDLSPFLTNIRRGHPAPPDLLAEVRRRYEAIGGRSPLGDICRELVSKLESTLGVKTRLAMRLWHPYPRDVLAELAREGVDRVVVLPLAQHSAKVYGDAVAAAAEEIARDGGGKIDVVCADNWGREPLLVRAYADAILRALEGIAKDERLRTTMVMTAHSLPLAVVRAGDPYEREVRASAAAIALTLGAAAPRHVIAFQSQGMGTGPGGKPLEWLGPDLKSTLDEVAVSGDKHILFAPIGFLADHVEILYDLDLEARAWAEGRGLAYARTASLNASDALVATLAEVARPLLGGS